MKQGHHRGRAFSAAVIAALGVSLCGVSNAQGQSDSTPQVDASLAPYASKRDSVRLPDGRKLHLVCMGRGSPVVILTAGAGQWSITWNKVQPKLAQRTRVCSWDRAGFGLSTPPPSPQTVLERTTDLQKGLEAGGIRAPYVLVGHSLGSYDSLVLADREPTKVAGMVLVDPSYPGQYSVFQRVAPRTIEWMNSRSESIVQYFRMCAAEVRTGKVWKGLDDPNNCMKGPRPPEFPPELNDEVQSAKMDAGPEGYADYFETQIPFYGMQALERDSPLAVKLGRNYGSMPLIVLTAGIPDTLPSDAPPETAPESAARAAAWGPAHDELAALSQQGINRVVYGSAHPIQQMKPQAVIDAVNEVVNRVRRLQK